MFVNVDSQCNLCSGCGEGKKIVLKAKALSDSYRFCDNSNTYVCLFGDNICAVCGKLSSHKSSFIRSRYTGGSNAYNIL